MLIVNADDLGGFPAATDAIARCFDAGAITSATLMVGKDDSRRAAEMAVAGDWPVGLHLNLREPLPDGDGAGPSGNRAADAGIWRRAGDDGSDQSGTRAVSAAGR